MNLNEVTVHDLFNDELINMAIHHMKEKKRNGEDFDGYNPADIEPCWDEYKNMTKWKVFSGEYVPKPHLKFVRKKRGGKGNRILEVPCIGDRMLQYALLKLLEPLFEPLFSDRSFGFRKGRCNIQAINLCRDDMNDGYEWAVDLDIEKCFDTLDHSILKSELSKVIKDKLIMKLIDSYLHPKVIAGVHYYRKHIGVVQGSSISPLFANVYLNLLDRFLDGRDVRYVRYADDIICLCKTRDEALIIFNLIEMYLKHTLRLKLNHEKSFIRRADEVRFLGYSFFKDDQGIYQLCIGTKTQARMRESMDKTINRVKTTDDPKWWDRIGAFNRGWINYFKYSEETHFRDFLSLAEAEEVKAMCDRIRREDSGSDAIQALFNSRNYISLTEWYNHVQNKKEKDLYG